MKESIPDVPHSRDNAIRFFIDFVQSRKENLHGKIVVDLSAGSGFVANEFYKAGCIVKLFDLFPEQNKFCPIAAQQMDLQQVWPIESNSVDYLILGETIEHLPNQHFFFQEAGRVLQANGTLLLTTPNASSLRSRFSQFLMESEHYSAPPPNEWDAFTRWPGRQDGYFSKLFISGILRLRTLAALHQLKIKHIYPTRASSTSRLLLIFYPIIYFFSRKNFEKQTKQDPRHESTYQEIFRINTSFQVLLGKHLIVEFTKQA
jgi:SAM-dependent methyltransferase